MANQDGCSMIRQKSGWKLFRLKCEGGLVRNGCRPIGQNIQTKLFFRLSHIKRRNYKWCADVFSAANTALYHRRTGKERSVMKKIPTLTLFAIGLAGALAWTTTDARADFEVSASVHIHAAADFTAPLSSCGTWVEVGSYGRCWRPAGIVVGWRPYCNGYWVWTDCGWYWASDEPWAWACYHYGSWRSEEHTSELQSPVH